MENPSKDALFAPRHYTLSCRPSDAADRLRLTVKRLRAPTASVDDGIMSSYVNQLKPGDVVRRARPRAPSRVRPLPRKCASLAQP